MGLLHKVYLSLVINRALIDDLEINGDTECRGKYLKYVKYVKYVKSVEYVKYVNYVKYVKYVT